MKKIFFVLTILFSSNAWAQNAAQLQNVCNGVNADPIINFQTSYGELKYDFSQTRNSLTALGKDYGIIEHGLFASGLALVSVQWEISVSTMSRRIDNNVCVIPVNIDIFIGFQDPVIYVSRDIRPDSCEYNVVLRHEQTHQQINKTALDHFLPLFRDAIRRISHEIKPLKVNDFSESDSASQLITDEYIKKVEPVVELFKQEIMNEQMKLDNAKNYQMEADLCRKGF